MNLLKLNLQFFSDEGADESQGQKEQMIPKTRFDEINNKYKDVQTQLQELMNKQQEAERKAAEEAGNYKKLYEDSLTELNSFKENSTSLEDRYKQLESVVGELLTAKLNNIPEKFHDLIPDNLSVEAKLSWITKAEEKGLFGVQQKEVGGQTNDGSYSELTKEQFAAMSYADRVKLYQTNPSLYTKLTN